MAEEELRANLFEQWTRDQSPDTRNKLVESYAPLAEFFAGRYRNRGADQEDLRQVAHLALVGAVDRFDPSFGVKFSTFAGRTIDGELKRYFRDKTWAVRVPRSLKERSLEIRRAADRLANDSKQSPTVAELVAETGFEEDQVLEALNVQATGYRADSLDKPAGTEDGRSLGDSLAETGDQIETVEIQLAVRSVMAELPERERSILHMRFFQNRSQQEIADEIGVSQMHVSRLLRKTLEGMREQLRP